MTHSELRTRTRRRDRRRWAVIGGVGVALLGLVTWRFLGSRPPGPEPEVALADLVRADGRLVFRRDTNQVFTGWVTDHYADGSVRSRSQVVDGRLHGVSEGWHPDGQLQVREHFVAGTAEGPVTKWQADGVKLSEGVALGGRLEGIFRRWHPNGRLAEEITLRAGQPDGFARAWFPSGHLKAEVELEGGQVVRQQFWEDGQRPGVAEVSQNKAPAAIGDVP